MNTEHLIEQIAASAIVFLDAQGVIRSWNAGARAITGYRADEVLGKPLFMLFPDDVHGRRLREDLIERVSKAGRVAVESWVVRKNGRSIWTRNVIDRIHAKNGSAALCWLSHEMFGDEELLPT